MTEREIQKARARLELDSKREKYLKEADNKHRTLYGWRILTTKEKCF